MKIVGWLEQNKTTSDQKHNKDKQLHTNSSSATTNFWWKKKTDTSEVRMIFIMVISALLLSCDSAVAAEASSARPQPLRFRLPFPHEGLFPEQFLRVVDGDSDLCQERLEDALSSIYHHYYSDTIPAVLADTFDSALIRICSHYPDRCDGKPPNDIIAFNLFENDSFIVREGYTETQILRCYCSKYQCRDDMHLFTTSSNISDGYDISKEQEVTVAATAIDVEVVVVGQQEQQEEEQVDHFFEIYDAQAPPHVLDQYFPPLRLFSRLHPHSLPLPNHDPQTTPETEINSEGTFNPPRPRPSPAAISPRHDGRIFVSIASYRDAQLLATIASLLAMCAEPQKLTVVICEQVHPDDPPLDLHSVLPSSSSFSFSSFSFSSFSASGLDAYSNTMARERDRDRDRDRDRESSDEGLRVVRLSMDSSLARGPTWARYLIQQYWTGEQFYLQLDSHMRFVQNWDSQLRSDLRMLPPKSCLTNYPPRYDVVTDEVDSLGRGPMYATLIDRMDRFVRFNSDYVVTNQTNKDPKPLLSKGWSGCFSFSSSQILLDAPYDPYLPFLFFGEEMDIFARLYTRGWLMYVPTLPVCFTAFDRSYRPTYWGHPDNEVVRFARMRLHHKFGLLSVQDELQQGKEWYYLGKEKSMTDFLAYLGLNPAVYFNESFSSLSEES